MKETFILVDTDFCEDSVYRSKRAEEKKLDWNAWADANLSEKHLKEIERALKKM